MTPKPKRNDKLTPAELAKARKHAEKGLSYRSIGAMLGRGASTVHEALNPSERSSKCSSVRASVRAKRTNTRENKPEREPERELEQPAAPPLERLARCLEFLDRATSFCASAEDWNRVSMIQKIVKDVVKTISDLTPVPPPNLDESPAVVKAAQEFNRKFFERAERILAGES